MHFVTCIFLLHFDIMIPFCFTVFHFHFPKITSDYCTRDVRVDHCILSLYFCFLFLVTNMTTSAVLTSSTEPSTVAEVKTTLTSDACVDHPDCDVLLNDFDACNDTYVAMTVCRKSCAVCDVTTNAPSCFDVHQDCKILSEHLNVCENENFARTRCAQTCGVCGNMILTDKKLSRQILLFYVHFVKFFYLFKID